MITIAVTENVRSQNKVNSKGEAYVARSQEAGFQPEGSHFTQPIWIRLGRDQAPYASGNYTLSPDNFYVNQYKQLQLKLALDLVPHRKPLDMGKVASA